MNPSAEVIADENPINLKDAAAILNSHPERVRQLAKLRLVPAMQIGGSGRWYFYASELRQYLRDAMRQGLKQAGGESCQSGGGSTPMVKQKRPISTSRSQVTSDYAKALGLNRIKKEPRGSRKNITMQSASNSGDRPNLVSVPAKSGRKR